MIEELMIVKKMLLGWYFCDVDRLLHYDDKYIKEKSLEIIIDLNSKKEGSIGVKAIIKGNMLNIKLIIIIVLIR